MGYEERSGRRGCAGQERTALHRRWTHRDLSYYRLQNNDGGYSRFFLQSRRRHTRLTCDWSSDVCSSDLIVADVPRAEIDLNRDEREIDPALVVPRPHPAELSESPRTRGGLGLVPARIAGAGAIWRQRIPAPELSRRIEAVYRPYHAALESALIAARDRFGIAILLDCHSMPPRPDPGREPPVVLGDRYGTSIDPGLADAAEAAVRRCGYAVARNAPYAGGHITDRHGRPAEGTHALQVEIDRSLYLDPALRAPGSGFDAAASLIAELARALAARALEPPEAIAAE